MRIIVLTLLLALTACDVATMDAVSDGVHRWADDPMGQNLGRY